MKRLVRVPAEMRISCTTCARQLHDAQERAVSKAQARRLDWTWGVAMADALIVEEVVKKPTLCPRCQGLGYRKTIDDDNTTAKLCEVCSATGYMVLPADLSVLEAACAAHVPNEFQGG